MMDLSDQPLGTVQHAQQAALQHEQWKQMAMAQQAAVQEAMPNSFTACIIRERRAKEHRMLAIERLKAIPWIKRYLKGRWF